MSIFATFCGNFSPFLSLSSQYCSSCSNFELRSRPFLASSVICRKKRCRLRNSSLFHVSRFHEKRWIICRVTETETEPDSNDDKEKEVHEVVTHEDL